MFVVPLVLQRILEVTSVSKLQRVQHLGHTAGSPSVRGCTALHSRRTMGDEHEVTHVLGRLVEQLLHELQAAIEQSIRVDSFFCLLIRIWPQNWANSAGK